MIARWKKAELAGLIGRGRGKGERERERERGKGGTRLNPTLVKSAPASLS